MAKLITIFRPDLLLRMYPFIEIGQFKLGTY